MRGTAKRQGGGHGANACAPSPPSAGTNHIHEPPRLTRKETWTDEEDVALVPAMLAAAVLLVSATASAAPGNNGFGFNARDISGFPTGAATLTGGGAYNPVSGFVHSAGGFRCTSDIGQGPLAGCLAGEGVRWDTVNLRGSTTFKCTGAAAEPLKTAATDENTVGA